VAGQKWPETTAQILRFLHENAGMAFCTRCISERVFDGRNIDVAMRHAEARGMKRHHGQCSACGKPRLVAGVSAN